MAVRVRNLPIYQKSEEIVDITRAIVDTADKECDEYELVRLMLGNAYMISAKIVAAEGGELYHLRMEAATQVKIAACDLLSQTIFCEIQNLVDSAYLDLLRNEVEEFRQLFVSWVKSFDRKKDTYDGWGLFEQSED